MPAFELIDTYTPEIFNPNNVPNSEVPIDMTGKRVEAYAKIVKIALAVRKLSRLVPSTNEKQFKFQNEESYDALKQFDCINRLKPNRLKVVNGSSSLYSMASSFQRKATELWRGLPNIASLLIPPVSPEDETTNIGAAKVVLSLLVLCGILQVIIEGDKKRFKLHTNYKERRLMIVGDGLSQIRVRTFADLMAETSYSKFDDDHENCNVIQKALKQTINITGDLHGGCFHFLQAVFHLFFGSIIQPIQVLLGWKRIRGSDVTKCYQQAASLAILIADEIDRQMFGTFLVEMLGNPAFGIRFNAIEDSRDAALHVANEYEKWKATKVRESDDEVFVMCLNFIETMMLYRLFRLSIRNGDAVMIEWLYKEFLPIYFICGKMHYYEIVMKMMDDMYDTIPGKILHLVRVNRTVPLHRGRDRNGAPMASWSMDGIIELLMKFYHKMKFENNHSGWFRHSAHVMLKNKAKRFVQESYTKGAMAIFSDTRAVDHVEEEVRKKVDEKKNSSVVPKRTNEKVAIAEFLHITSCTVEQRGRKYNSSLMWSALKDVKIEIVQASVDEQREILLSADDDFISDQVDGLFANQSNASSEKSSGEMSDTDSDAEVNSDSDSDSECDSGGDGNVVEIQLERIGEEGDTIDASVSGGEEGGDVNADNNGDDDVSVQIGPSRRLSKVKRAKVNPLGFVKEFGECEV
jgi:hypothetical protein